MKMERFYFPSGQEAVTIATGVTGGGYVGISSKNSGVSIGTSEFLKDVKQYVYLHRGSEYYKFYLKEGEKLYSRGMNEGTVGNYVDIEVIYYNDEPLNQSQPAPINLSGTIQLNQQ